MFLVDRQSVSNVGEISYEPGPPRREGGCHLPEEVIVPFFLKTPSGHKENVHEHFLMISGFQVGHHIYVVSNSRPGYVEFAPASLTERAMEEKVLNSFLNMFPT